MDPNNCFAALSQHHKTRASNKFHDTRSTHEVQQIPVVQITGAELAARFADEACKVLGQHELRQLRDFFMRPPGVTVPRKELHENLTQKLQAFYGAEVEESGEERNQLTSPSGPEDAELGLIMHCQTKQGEIGPFWDAASASIQVLAAKGLSDEFAFCYDWHWRAESSLRGRGSCPAKKWKRPVKELHDTLSSDILAMLPLPFLVVAGTCARMHYEKTSFSSQTRRLEVMLIPGSNFTFDLDFSGHRMKRVTAYINHPAAGFFGRPAGDDISIRIDAAFNFLLWLIGKEHDPISVQRRYSKHQHGVPALTAPLKEIRHYVRLEKESQRTLQKDEYGRDFWSWAEGFLKEAPSAILQKGFSVVVAVRKELNVNPKLLPGNSIRCPSSDEDFLEATSLNAAR